jgi:hypothetical protein
MRVHGKIVVEPNNMEDSSHAIADHRGLAMKPKRQQSHVLGDMRWDLHSNRRSRYLLASDSMPVRAYKLIPVSLCELPADSGTCRSAFRTDVDHDSEVMPISVPN